MQFVREILFGSRNFLFFGREAREQAFLAEVSRTLDEEAGSLILVGSAKLGFSLNPNHLLRSFLPGSDIDLVIVNGSRFDACWIELIQREDEFVLAGEDEKKRQRKSLETIQRGYLRSDRLPISSSLAIQWFPKFAGPFQADELRKHELSGWLFRTREHAIQYYASQLAKVHDAINAQLNGGA